MNGMLEALAYAIARGIARAWFEVKAEQSLALEEKPDADDRRRAANFAGAIGRVRSESQGNSGFLDPTQGGK
jgi:hypothetical protein